MRAEGRRSRQWSVVSGQLPVKRLQTTVRRTASSFILPPSSFILSSLARAGGEAPARLDASAELSTDLKLDSLGRVEFLSALEDRYQIEIDEAAFTAATTVGDIERIVQRGRGARRKPRRNIRTRAGRSGSP